MHRGLLFAVFFAILTTAMAVGHAQTATKKPAKKRSPVTLIVIGKAVATTQATPDCGVFAFAQKARFRVIRVLRGVYKRKFVDVTLPCRNVRVGLRTTLYLGNTPKHRFTWSILGKLPKPARPAFWSFGKP